jgi:hypothetical protein
VRFPDCGSQQQQPTLTEVVDKIVVQEQAEVQSLRQYAPIVETYIKFCGQTRQGRSGQRG